MTKFDFEMIPVPADALETIGLVPGIPAEAFVEGKRIIIQKARAEEFCEFFNDDCEGCPLCCPCCGECLKEQLAVREEGDHD